MRVTTRPMLTTEMRPRQNNMRIDRPMYSSPISSLLGLFIKSSVLNNRIVPGLVAVPNPSVEQGGLRKADRIVHVPYDIPTGAQKSVCVYECTTISRNNRAFQS